MTSDMLGNSKLTLGKPVSNNSSRSKFVMNDTIKPQLTSFAQRNSQLDGQKRTLGCGSSKQNPLIPKSSSEFDTNLPIPETELSGEDTEVAFGRETEDMTHPVNSSWSILDKSGPGTERGAM